MKRSTILTPALLLALLLLSGCGTAESKEPAALPSPSPSPSGSAAQPLEDRLAALAGGDYAALRAFVDENLPNADAGTAGKMVQALVVSSENSLTPANDYIYSDQGGDPAVQEAIFTAVDSLNGAITPYRPVCAGDKQTLLDALPAGGVKDSLTAWFARGLCLECGEGSYYFAVDYPEYLDSYASAADPATAEFLHITSAESLEPLTVEEYLAVSPATLGERAAAYESFLAGSPDFPLGDTVRVLLNVAVAKLSFPSPFDSLTDEQGKVVPDMLAVYEKLAAEDGCPVIQSVSRDMLGYIAEQPDGVVCQNYDVTALNENSAAITAQAQKQIAQLYGKTAS